MRYELTYRGEPMGFFYTKQSLYLFISGLTGQTTREIYQDKNKYNTPPWVMKGDTWEVFDHVHKKTYHSGFSFF